MHKYIIATALLLATGSAAAQPQQRANEMQEFKVDSVLYDYYQTCKQNLFSEDVIAMCDTLFRMAGQKGDQRMQAVAMSTALDHYYFSGQQDSVVANVCRVQEFAKKTGQPKYYYFVWGSRLIQYYIKAGMLATAMSEAQEMLRDAQQADDKQGLASCYGVLSTIYQARRMTDEAVQSKLKEIELIETYDLDRYNLANAYHTVFLQYLADKDLLSALAMLEKAESVAYGDMHIFNNAIYRLKYYIAADDRANAYKWMREVDRMFAADPKLYNSRRKLYDARYGYYYYARQYDNALKAVGDLRRSLEEAGEEGMVPATVLYQADTYYAKGSYEHAAKKYREYTIILDSLSALNERNSISEFATLLEVERIDSEKRAMQLEMQTNRLRNIRVGIVALAICLTTVLIFYRRERKANLRLKISEASLKEKNQILEFSEEQLRVARDKAERASEMKSAFMHNMTHEIRTPLNSIVGFSDLIADMMAPDSPAHEFSAMIRQNNTRLLKLIDDVLDLSAIDSGSEVDMHPTDLDQCCRDSIKDVRGTLPPGVELLYRPGVGSPVMLSSAHRISQILFNLLQNAVRATSAGSITLSWELSADGKEMRLAVEDTGPGIPADKGEEVFERFVKLSDFSQGFGLGLSISRLLARRMGGELALDTLYTSGCRMVLTLPYVPAEMDRNML